MSDSLKVLGIAFLILLFCAVPLFFLWNWLMPIIFGLPEITFAQSFGLMFLSGILFKNSSVGG